MFDCKNGNFLLSEHSCSHCQTKYNENRSKVHPYLLVLAQDVRDILNAIYAGGCTMDVTGYRCPEHNNDMWLSHEEFIKTGIGFKNYVDPNSNHMYGKALDMTGKKKGVKLDPVMMDSIIHQCAKVRGFKINTEYKYYLKTSKHVHVNLKI